MPTLYIDKKDEREEREEGRREEGRREEEKTRYRTYTNPLKKAPPKKTARKTRPHAQPRIFSHLNKKKAYPYLQPPYYNTYSAPPIFPQSFPLYQYLLSGILTHTHKKRLHGFLIRNLPKHLLS
jgi:hypothetical protein